MCHGPYLEWNIFEQKLVPILSRLLLPGLQIHQEQMRFLGFHSTRMESHTLSLCPLQRAEWNDVKRERFVGVTTGVGQLTYRTN